MRSHAKTAAVIATVAVLTAWVSVRAARAQEYPGRYDPAAGQYYSQEARSYYRLASPGAMMYLPGENPYRASANPAYYYPAYPYAAYPYAAQSSTEGYYTPSTSDYSYGAFAPQSDCANIRVILPRADAKVWFSDSLTKQTGQMREFVSPKLNPNKDYAYDIKAQWEENGKLVTRTRHVNVSANSTVSVDFTR